MKLEIYAKRDGAMKVEVSGVRAEVVRDGLSAWWLIASAARYIGAHVEIERVTVSERTEK